MLIHLASVCLKQVTLIIIKVFNNKNVYILEQFYMSNLMLVINLCQFIYTSAKYYASAVIAWYDDKNVCYWGTQKFGIQFFWFGLQIPFIYFYMNFVSIYTIV